MLISKDLAAHRVPGTPVIGTTEFFRLAAPDRRRIENKELPNFTAYSFGKSWPSELGAAFLIDQYGTILYPTWQVSREFECFLGGMIECLLAQRPLSVGAGSPHQ
ncbi:MAG: hypothetical protein JJD97_09295 [Gemmatimonadaceae bacterium]|nr:hypothetical protein [Gemmatimonadaceae bacterium]